MADPSGRTSTSPQPVGAAADVETLDERLSLRGRSLRAHTARGTIINAAFNIGLAGLGLIRQLLVAVFLTASEFGLWGVIYVSVITLIVFKEVGISDKFIQQSESDQEVAFQKAFTLNLLWTLPFFFVALGGIPIFALIYGRPDIIAPGSVLALAVLASGLSSPTWIFYRQMRFARQRTLQAVDPIVAFVVTVALAVAGAGYWSLIIGGVCGMWVGGLVALRACPYRLKLVFDRLAVREYFSFSWPLLISTGSGVVVLQAGILTGEAVVGLAGVGAIGLASTIARFTERVDQIVTQTIYPAVCAVRDRADLLFEAFTKSNRLALMWGMPFGVGLAVFAPDLVEFVLGEKWRVATGLIQVFGILAGINQIAFNWTAFLRAVGQTRPFAVSGILGMVTFLAVGVPMTIAYGLTGYAVGVIAVTVVDMVVRTYFLARLFSGFEMLRHSARAMAPSLPAVAAVLGVRLLEGSDRSGGLVIAELVLYTVVTLIATWAAERALLREVGGYLRRAAGAPQPA